MVVAMDATIYHKYRDYLKNERVMTPRSIRDYSDTFLLISSKIDPISCQTYKDVNDSIKAIKEEKGYSQGSVYKLSICVRHLFRWLQREQYRPDNPFPFSDWKKPRPKAPKFLTEKDFEDLVNDPFLNHQELTLLYLLWDSGARIGEIEKLKQQNINLETGIVNIPYEISKGNYSFRYVPISQFSKNLLSRQFQLSKARGHGEAIFLNAENEIMTISGLQKVIVAIGLRKSPLRDSMRLSPHQFRHSFGIRMLERGVPQVIVQKWLGHQTLQMTSHYVNMTQESSRRIFEQYLTC